MACNRDIFTLLTYLPLFIKALAAPSDVRSAGEILVIQKIPSSLLIALVIGLFKETKCEEECVQLFISEPFGFPFPIQKTTRLKYNTIIFFFRFLSNVTGQIKSKSVRWAGHLSLMGEMRQMLTKF
jgi:hypothetical protein